MPGTVFISCRLAPEQSQVPQATAESTQHKPMAKRVTGRTSLSGLRAAWPANPPPNNVMPAIRESEQAVRSWYPSFEGPPSRPHLLTTCIARLVLTDFSMTDEQKASRGTK